MRDDLTALTEAEHYLDWLGEDPGRTVRDTIEQILREQIASSELVWLRLIGEPEFLTGGKPEPRQPNMLKVTRAALAVEFELLVKYDGGENVLRGVFSKATVGLDGPEPLTQSHLDLDMDLETASKLLQMRIYGFEEPSKPNEHQPREVEPVKIRPNLLNKLKNSILGKS